eukprot:gene3309-3794_t
MTSAVKISMEIWQFSIFIISSVTAVTLNCLIYFLVYNNRGLQTPFNFTILNACFADILVSVNLIVSSIYMITQKHKVIDTGFCNATGFVTLLSFVASVMCLAAVSLNRYLMVCHSRYYKRIFARKRRIVPYLLTTWLFSALISVPPLLGWGRFSYHPGKAVCFVDWSASISYMIFMIAICFCGPLFVTLLSLYFILRTKRDNEDKLDGDNKFNEDHTIGKVTKAKLERRKKQIAKEERKITVSILVIAVVFMIAWGPFVIVMFTGTFGKQRVPPWADFATLLLGCLNSTANPIVYLTLNSNFRKELRKLFNRVKSNDGSDMRSGTSLEVGTPKLTPKPMHLKRLELT